MTPPMFGRMVVAVDDSAGALTAVHVAVEVALLTGGLIRFVHVIGDGELVRALGTMGRDGKLAATRSQSADALLRHVHAEAHGAGVRAETVSLTGHPAGLLLSEARQWGADVIIMGRSNVRGAGRAYVGAVTREVLEFSETPVLVVPQPT
jgi:nucleotide-binding universal stress UspA family protein